MTDLIRISSIVTLDVNVLSIPIKILQPGYFKRPKYILKKKKMLQNQRHIYFESKKKKKMEKDIPYNYHP